MFDKKTILRKLNPQMRLLTFEGSLYLFYRNLVFFQPPESVACLYVITVLKKQIITHRSAYARLFYFYAPGNGGSGGMTAFPGNYLFQKRFRLCVTFRLKRELNPGDRISNRRGPFQSISPQLSAVVRNVIFF